MPLEIHSQLHFGVSYGYLTSLKHFTFFIFHLLTILNIIYPCRSRILLAGCLLEDINRNCGIRARHGTMEYLHRSNFVNGSCPLSYRISLLPGIDKFNLTEEQKTFAISELERMKISDEV
ncbi:hypothetical protein AVEN_213733-1 [Araneus ventricosus]|uniref:Uncharacterized protein n=2 Tax=Araneus ventricosus TaxID=182803 RepID=A0A4Y2GHL6_ARAVE|nr:hypothetical protein AVEN_8420-1 [Araneus ventricosus]GBM52266.1 hypothetical protein AVEN_16709-1 [Araneus ventricosus]GBM52379.1 hypothetical protein AVEN_213733-1 [Araneus ventricosus]